MESKSSGQIKRKVTMQDVADALRISVSAVSLALNDKPGVTKELRKAVRDTCTRLGYEFKPKLANGRETAEIGLLVRTESMYSKDPKALQMIMTLQKEAERLGYHLILNSLTFEEENQGKLPHFLEKPIRGVITDSGFDKEYLRRLINHDLPMVTVGYDPLDFPVNSVDCDNLFGARTATEYLIRMGHRRIGLISGYPENHVHQGLLGRVAGYLLALRQAGIRLDDSLMITDLKDTGREMGRQATEQILAASGREAPDAFFCVTDEYATGCLQYLQEQGYKVPADISVMGFDNHYWVGSLSPALTTMNLPYVSMGKVALHRLITLINARSMGDHPEAVRIQLPVELIERESVADRTSRTAKPVTHRRRQAQPVG